MTRCPACGRANQTRLLLLPSDDTYGTWNLFLCLCGRLDIELLNVDGKRDHAVLDLAFLLEANDGG